MRRRLILLFLPALLIGLLTAALTWLLRSESGAGWIWQRVVASVPGELKATRLQGSLRSGIEMVGLDYRLAGFHLQADRLNLQVELDFLPPAVSVDLLRIGELNMVSSPEDGDDDPVAWDWIAALELPVPVEFRRIAADRISWGRAGTEPTVDLRAVSLGADWYHRIRLRDARFAGWDSDWRGDLRFTLRPPHRFDLTLAGDVALEGLSPVGERVGLEARASGSLSESRWQLVAPERGLSLGGTLSNLLAEPAWDLQLEAERYAWPPGAEQPDWVAQQVVASSYGTSRDHDLEANARFTANGLPPIDIRLVGAGQGSALDFERVDLDGRLVQASGSGQLNWSTPPMLAADLEVSHFDPAPLLESWGDAAPASGQLNVRWQNGRLSFALMNAQAEATVADLSADGSLDTVSGELSADLEWRQLTWPPGGDDPQVTSEEGRARIAGALDEWNIEGELTVEGPDLPRGHLQLKGAGNRESLALQVPHAEALGGSLSGSARIDWSGAPAWSVEAQLKDVATGPLFPDFPGRISGSVDASGRAADTPGEADDLRVDIRSLTGVVRERTISADGTLIREKGRLNAQGLRLRSGQARLQADGNLQGPAGLTVQADIPALADLVGGASGRFSGSGTISLAAGQPAVRLEGSGSDLAWGDIAVKRLELGPAERKNGVRIEAESLRYGDRLVETVAAETGGSTPLETLDAGFSFAEGEVRLRLAGATDWSAPLQRGWAGRVEVLGFDGPGLGSLHLLEPADLSVSASGLRLGTACFEGSRQGQACLEGVWDGGGERRLDAHLENVSPNLVVRLLGYELTFSQRLSGSLAWSKQPDSMPAAQVRLDVSPGSISEPGEEDPVLTTGAGLFAFQISEGELHSGELDIPLEGNGKIDTDFSVPDLSAGTAAQVEGRLRVDLADIEPLLRLVPGLEGSSGPVSADLRMTGTLQDPRLTGHFALVRGRISHFASGLLLEDIRLAGAVYEFDQTELSGVFRAGQGQGTLRMVVNFEDPLNPELRLEVRGSQLTLIDVPDLRVTADPDLRVNWKQGNLNLDGRVEVPSARLSPRYLPTASASVSDDVVIVNGEDDLNRELEAEPQAGRIYGQLELALGDDVQLRLDRATAKLGGAAEFQWDGQLVPVATGGFGVSGEIYAYGQLLTVTDGRVNFSGRPADNPFLNIRAEREIYGNTQVTRAGVLVSGTLKKPDVEVYTVPMTTRERALTLLVTGSDFDYEQGVGSVEVGMYVAPKLYISYGIGLFDDQNVISARYDLGKGFGIKTTSGQRETGADISYTIER